MNFLNCLCHRYCSFIILTIYYKTCERTSWYRVWRKSSTCWRKGNRTQWMKQGAHSRPEAGRGWLPVTSGYFGFLPHERTFPKKYFIVHVHVRVSHSPSPRPLGGSSGWTFSTWCADSAGPDLQTNKQTNKYTNKHVKMKPGGSWVVRARESTARGRESTLLRFIYFLVKFSFCFMVLWRR